MREVDGQTYGMEKCPYEDEELVRLATKEYGDSS